MSDEEQDYAIENADAGASLEIPMEAGQVKKGGYMNIKGRPCKVLSISVSKTGKHGHAKCNFETVDIFNGKKVMDMVPSTHGTTVPIVNKVEWEIMNIDDEDFMSLYNDSGEEKNDLKLPDFPDNLAGEIRECWDEGNNQCIVTVQTAMGIEAVVGYKKGTE
jgi:translation initiation factor 5A